MANYIVSSLIKNLKMKVTLCLIITLIIFLTICVAGMRRTVLSSNSEQFGQYAAVAITPRVSADPLIGVQEGLIQKYAFSEYVTDYYAFFLFETVSSDTIESLASESRTVSDPDGTMDVLFSIYLYSDIEKSVSFRTGTRTIDNGRFAENIRECNISVELAELNGLSVGDTIDLLPYNEVSFEIVGLFSDQSLETRSEADIITPKTIGNDEYRTSASLATVSRNDILTVAESTADISVCMPFYKGYKTVVYYIRDEQSIPDFISKVQETLPTSFAILDSLDVSRYLHSLIVKTEKSLLWLLIIVGVIALVFITLTLIHILKESTYEIGVFRIWGLARNKTAVLFSIDFSIVCIVSYLLASTLYLTWFPTLSKCVFAIQRFISNNVSSPYIGSVLNAGQEYQFIADIEVSELMVGFAAIILFGFALSAATTIFITRHEPMKTMTRY